MTTRKPRENIAPRYCVFVATKGRAHINHLIYRSPFTREYVSALDPRDAPTRAKSSRARARARGRLDQWHITTGAHLRVTASGFFLGDLCTPRETAVKRGGTSFVFYTRVSPSLIYSYTLSGHSRDRESPAAARVSASNRRRLLIGTRAVSTGRSGELTSYEVRFISSFLFFSCFRQSWASLIV